MEVVKKSLHPLVKAAAVSVTIFSAVGVAALTGVLPHSRGTEAPAVAMPAVTPTSEATAVPEATPAPVAKPKPRPAHVVSRAVPPKPMPATEPVQVAQAPAVVPGATGVIASVKEVEKKGETSGVGPVAGGVLGGVIGHQVGSGNTSKVMTVLGAGAGILGGKMAEEKVGATKQWEITVQLDKGGTQTITSDTEPSWHQGDRVRVLDGKLQPA